MSLPVSQCLRFSVAALLAGSAASTTYAQTTKEGTLGSGKSTLDEIRGWSKMRCRPSSAVKIPLWRNSWSSRRSAPSLSQTFVLKNALSGVFGLASPVFAPECSRTGTPVRTGSGRVQRNLRDTGQRGQVQPAQLQQEPGGGKHPFSVASRVRREIRPEKSEIGRQYS